MPSASRAAGEGEEAEELRRLLESHGSKDNFSTWLYMHSFRELADELRPIHGSAAKLAETIADIVERWVHK